MLVKKSESVGYKGFFIYKKSPYFSLEQCAELIGHVKRKRKCENMNWKDSKSLKFRNKKRFFDKKKKFTGSPGGIYPVTGCAPNVLLRWRSRCCPSCAVHNAGGHHHVELLNSSSRRRVDVCLLLPCVLAAHMARQNHFRIRGKSRKECGYLRTAPKKNLRMKYIGAWGGDARASQRMVNYFGHLQLNISFENRKTINEEIS